MRTRKVLAGTLMALSVVGLVAMAVPAQAEHMQTMYDNMDSDPVDPNYSADPVPGNMDITRTDWNHDTSTYVVSLDSGLNDTDGASTGLYFGGDISGAGSEADTWTTLGDWQDNAAAALVAEGTGNGFEGLAYDFTGDSVTSEEVSLRTSESLLHRFTWDELGGTEDLIVGENYMAATHNSDGMSIDRTAATPEPGTMSLALLAALAGGAVVWRRRSSEE